MPLWFLSVLVTVYVFYTCVERVLRRWCMARIMSASALIIMLGPSGGVVESVTIESKLATLFHYRTTFLLDC
jgi:hypothetical protein